MKDKIILITGASRGIGRLTALELAKRGHRVYGTMRSPQNIEGISALPLDVTNNQTIQNAVNTVIEKEGRIDVVINNAGYGLFGPVEMTNEEEVFRQFDVNVFGVLRVIRAAVPQMRKQKSGHIINMSSIAGVTTNMGLGIYCGTKHALEAISESLAATVAPWNIKVSVIEPGATQTEFAEVMEVAENLKKENPYEPFSTQYRERLREILREGQPTQEVAEVIADVVETENPDFRYQTNDHYRELIAQFITDPSGNRWIEDQKEQFGGWFRIAS